MRAVLPQASRADPRPRLGEVPDPTPGRGEVLIEVRATALNHADLLQVRGFYPPPAGESEVPGLECAGVVRQTGPGAERFRAGDRVMALLAGGGHAERVAAPEGQVLPLPEGLAFTDGAAIPEAGVTAWTNLVAEGGLRAGGTVLVAGAASGVGTFAVQVARELGARVLVAGRSAARLERLLPLGAEAWCLLDDDLPRRVRELTGGAGADLVLDLVGGEHLPRLLAALAPRGRLVLVGLMAGARAEVDLALVLHRRLSIVGSVLRSRSREEKAEVVAAFGAFALPRLAAGRLRPVVDRVLPFDRIADAYAALERGGVFGKVVVELEERY